MYTDHFSLSELPFNLTPDPKYLYLSASHAEALAQMVFGITMKRGFIMLTGEVGTGKTTIIHSLRDKIIEHTKTAFIYHAILGVKGLLISICKSFHIPFSPRNNKSELLMRISKFLQNTTRGGGNAALIIDEAQNLNTKILEQIRMLSNFETPNQKLIQIVLVGQPELKTRLAQNDLRQLRQRISLNYHLSPMDRIETEKYIYHRLSIAGNQNGQKIFTTHALDEIHEYTQGIPRSINIICDNALIMAYAHNHRTVEKAIIEKVKFDDFSSNIQEFDRNLEVIEQNEINKVMRETEYDIRTIYNVNTNRNSGIVNLVLNWFRTKIMNRNQKNSISTIKL